MQEPFLSTLKVIVTTITKPSFQISVMSIPKNPGEAAVWLQHKGAPQETVPLVSLNSVLRNIDVQLLKIEVEGYEWAV